MGARGEVFSCLIGLETEVDARCFLTDLPRRLLRDRLVTERFVDRLVFTFSLIPDLDRLEDRDRLRDRVVVFTFLIISSALSLLAFCSDNLSLRRLGTIGPQSSVFGISVGIFGVSA